MIYDIINPSDPVTMEAKTFEAALIATLLVGGGQYAAKPVEEGEEVRLFLFGGFDAWFEERYPGKKLDELIDENRADATAALRSFCTGSVNDRRLFDAALTAITDESKRQQFLAEWDDRKRSSLNQITKRAHAIADQVEAKASAAASA